MLLASSGAISHYGRIMVTSNEEIIAASPAENQAQPVRVLVVDDDPGIRELLRDMLEIEGYVVSEAVNGRQMFSALQKQPFDLVTLDLNLPGEDGLALAREMRAVRDVPIIIITAKDAEIDKVVGLEIGADDYITKPFSVREVLARVRAVLRRFRAPQTSPSTGDSGDQKLRFDGWVLNVPARELRNLAGEVRELTTAEFNMLRVFAERPARILSRDALMDALKGQDWTPVDRSIDALVSRLRKKIEKDPDHPSLIKTVRCVGYVFAASVASA
jgi:two-component system, OmpR family, response regulator